MIMQINFKFKQHFPYHKFQSVDEFIDFLQQCISLDQLQSENRCQQFTFKKSKKSKNNFLLNWIKK
mgnify:CR=1 FL=1